MDMARRTVAILFVMLLAWADFGTAAAEQMTYRLGPGDQVRITVFGQEDLSGEFEVSTTGTIALPLIGEVAVRNFSLRETETAIVSALKPDYLKNPRVAVEVLNYRPFYIIGEVNDPGSYPYVSAMRVLTAIALAGGFTYRARKDEIYITRVKGAAGERRPASQDTLVLPGDIIEVEERFF